MHVFLSKPTRFESTDFAAADVISVPSVIYASLEEWHTNITIKIHGNMIGYKCKRENHILYQE